MDLFGLIAPLFNRASPLTEDDHLFRLVDLPPQASVLDVGGGTGRAGEAFSKRASRVVIADPSIGMLRLAARKDGLIAVRAVAEALPFVSNAFDRIIMVDAFHHVPGQEEAVGELIRVVKPGGRVVVEEPNIQKTGVKLIALIEKLLLFHPNFKDFNLIRKLFGEHGAMTAVQEEKQTVWIVADKPGREHPPFKGD